MSNIYLAILLMAAVTYLIRLLPLLLLRRELKNQYLKSFLAYVPYVTLAVMTFPAILGATASVWSGLAGLMAALFFAWRKGNLIHVSLASCLSVFLVELFVA